MHSPPIIARRHRLRPPFDHHPPKAATVLPKSPSGERITVRTPSAPSGSPPSPHASPGPHTPGPPSPRPSLSGNPRTTAAGPRRRPAVDTPPQSTHRRSRHPKPGHPRRVPRFPAILAPLPPALDGAPAIDAPPRRQLRRSRHPKPGHPRRASSLPDNLYRLHPRRAPRRLAPAPLELPPAVSRTSHTFCWNRTGEYSSSHTTHREPPASAGWPASGTASNTTAGRVWSTSPADRTGHTGSALTAGRDTGTPSSGTEPSSTAASDPAAPSTPAADRRKPRTVPYQSTRFPPSPRPPTRLPPRASTQKISHDRPISYPLGATARRRT